MSWSRARAALYAIPRDVGLETWDAPPPELPVQGGPFCVFTPPARSFVRRPGDTRVGTYEQRLALFSWIPGSASPQEVNAVGLELDDAVEAITDALDGAIKLGGEAENVKSPNWQDATLTQYPEDSGRLYLMMTALIEVTDNKYDAGFAP